ncbi:MAG: hypothetical protein MUC28_03555 [Planctomycetes bacterium]|nr:hypothetical protein [Planctomycetota bacterium]
MKKAPVLLLFFLAIAGLLLASACAKKTDSTTTSRGASDIASRRPDFGQPERAADISGLVQSITANEVTVLKIDRPERGSASSTNGNTERRGDFPAGGGTSLPNLSGESGNRMFAGGAGGGGRMVVMGGPGGPGGEIGATERSAILEQLKAMSSGSVTVTIPVGIRMLKPDTTGETESQRRQVNMAEATLADITADKMVSIWLDESVTDRKIAEFVLITR